MIFDQSDWRVGASCARRIRTGCSFEVRAAGAKLVLSQLSRTHECLAEAWTTASQFGVWGRL